MSNNTVVVHNPTQAPVTDYPIENPKSKEVHLWAILPGQTLEFPDYVGSYLLEIYGFLQRVITKEQQDAEIERKKSVDEGRHFSQVKLIQKPRVVAIDKPEKPPGVTNKVVKGNAPIPQQLNPRVVQEQQPSQQVPVVPNVQAAPKQAPPPLPPGNRANQQLQQSMNQPIRTAQRVAQTG